MDMAIDMDRQPIPDPDFDFDIDVDVAIEIDDVRDQDQMLDGLETEAVDTRDEPMHEAEEGPHLMEVDDHYAEGGNARRLPPSDGFHAADGGTSLDLEGDVKFTEEAALAEDLTLPDDTNYIREVGEVGTGVDDSTTHTISAGDTLVAQGHSVDESSTLTGTRDLTGMVGHSGLNVTNGLGHSDVLEDYSESTYAVGRLEGQEIDPHAIALDAKQLIADSGSAESPTPHVGTRDRSVSSHSALPSPEASQAKDQKPTAIQPNADTKDNLLPAEGDEDFIGSDYTTNPHTFQPRLHPVTVYYAGNELYLFRQGVSDSTEDYLLNDESLAFASLSDLFAALRLVLGDNISEVDTLQIFVEKMDIDIFEDSISAQSWTLATIIDLHLQLCANDGIVDVVPLCVELIVEKGLQRKIRYIRDAVDKGLGYSRLDFRREVAGAKEDESPSGNTENEPTTEEPALTNERADGQSTVEPSGDRVSSTNKAADEGPATKADVSYEKDTVKGAQPSPSQQTPPDPEKGLVQSGTAGIEMSPNSYSTAPEQDGKSIADWSRMSDHPPNGTRLEQPSLSHHSEGRPDSAAERVSSTSTPHSRVRDEPDDPDLIDYEDDEYDQTEYVDQVADPEQPQATDTTTSPQPETSGSSTRPVDIGRSYAQPDSPGITYSEDEDEVEVDTSDQFNDRAGDPPDIAFSEDKDGVGAGDQSSHRAGDSPGITYSEDEDEAGAGDRSNDHTGNPSIITYPENKDEIAAGNQSNHAGESPGITYSEDEDNADAGDQPNDHAGDPAGITYSEDVSSGDRLNHQAGDSPGITYSEDEYEIDAGDQSNVRAGDPPNLDAKEDELDELGSDQEPGAHGQLESNDANIAVAARGGASGTIARETDLEVGLSGDLASKTAYDIEVEELEIGYTEELNNNAVEYDDWGEEEADPAHGTAQPPQPSITEGKDNTEKFELDLDVFDEDLTADTVKAGTSVDSKTAERAQIYRGNRSISSPEKIASVVADVPPQQANQTLNGEVDVVQSAVSAAGQDIKPYDLPKRGSSMSAASGLPSKRDHAAAVEPVAPGTSDQEAKRVRHS